MTTPHTRLTPRRLFDALTYGAVLGLVISLGSLLIGYECAIILRLAPLP